MIFTCDFCKAEVEHLEFDDAHGKMGGAMQGFFCEFCLKINDFHWLMSGLKIKADMEIQMNNRAFNRARKELV